MAVLYFAQRKILYIPPTAYHSPEDASLTQAIEIYAPEEKGSLLGWWIAPQNPAAPTIIYFHGNGSALDSASEIYKTFEAQGYGVFAVAYPGYPGRAGTPTQESLTAAATGST